MSPAAAFAKINLALVVGGRRADGKHEVVTLLQRLALHDTVTVEPGRELVVEGFEADTIVRGALAALATAAGVAPGWHVRIEKRIPVAAGLGGGSSDAATALTLANASLSEPLSLARLHEVAAGVGADVPFFLHDGARLGTGDGTTLEPVELPSECVVLLVVPTNRVKSSTADVYASFDERRGADGFAARAAALLDALPSLAALDDLASLPRNDLASSPLAAQLEAAGAVRADVTGAGPSVYGLFRDEAAANHAAALFSDAGDVYVTRPVGASGLA